MSGDPFDQIPLIGVDTFSHIQQMNMIRLPQNIKYVEPNSGDTLRDVLQQRLRHLSEGALQGLINFLDAKGLSRIEPNLDKRTIKTTVYQNVSQLGIMPQQTIEGKELQLDSYARS